MSKKILIVDDEAFIREHLSDFDILGFLPFGDELIEADLQGRSPYDVASAAKEKVRAMIEKL